MAYIPYAQQLLSPLWQKKRLKILERDNWTCQSCHSDTKNLQVHHLEYLGDIMVWDYPDDMLITLCFECHDKEQGRVSLEKHLATTLKMKGFLVSDLLAMSCKLENDNVFTQTLLNELRKYQNG